MSKYRNGEYLSGGDPDVIVATRDSGYKNTDEPLSDGLRRRVSVRLSEAANGNCIAATDDRMRLGFQMGTYSPNG
jgi:hypothetical protein